MSDLSETITQRGARWEPDALLHAMGYVTTKPRQRVRLAEVLDDPELGLSRGDYDFTYGSHDFLRALGAALGVEASDVEAHIDTVETRRDRERHVYRP